MTLREVREVLASGGLSLLFEPKEARNSESKRESPEQTTPPRQDESDKRIHRPKAETTG